MHGVEQQRVVARDAQVHRVRATRRGATADRGRARRRRRRGGRRRGGRRAAARPSPGRPCAGSARGSRAGRGSPRAATTYLRPSSASDGAPRDGGAARDLPQGVEQPARAPGRGSSSHSKVSARRRPLRDPQAEQAEEPGRAQEEDGQRRARPGTARAARRARPAGPLRPARPIRARRGRRSARAGRGARRPGPAPTGSRKTPNEQARSRIAMRTAGRRR